MATIDKTESAIGMTRGTVWAADAAQGDIGTAIGVGIDTTGKTVKGAGNTGIVGVAVRGKVFRFAGQVAEHCSLGEIVDVPGLPAGTKIYAANETGVLGTSATDSTYVGYTIEADRLVIRL